MKTLDLFVFLLPLSSAVTLALKQSMNSYASLVLLVPLSGLFVNLVGLPENWYCQFFLFSYQLLPSSNVGVFALFDLHHQQEFDLKNKFFRKESRATQHIHTCSKATVKILEQNVKYVSKSTENRRKSQICSKLTTKKTRLPSIVMLLSICVVNLIKNSNFAVRNFMQT